MPAVIMPKMGDAMEEGTLLRWLKQVGDDVAAGEPIAEIETDKVTLEMEATESGKLSRIIAAEGAVVPIGQPIAVIGEDDGSAGGAVPVIENAPGETPYEGSGEPTAPPAAALGCSGAAAQAQPGPGQDIQIPSPGKIAPFTMPQMPGMSGTGLSAETTPQSQVEVPMTFTSVPSATPQPMAP